MARLPAIDPQRSPSEFIASNPPVGQLLAEEQTHQIATEKPLDLKSLMRPRFKSSLEWAPRVDDIEVGTFDVSMTVPCYPIFGPPPPMITGGYSATRINAPVSLDLPSNLHEFSLGVGWIRPINDRWSARFMLSSVFASDLKNTTGDAWQIRAGGFAIYRPNAFWTFAFGALATGRDDLPVLPAAGVIWEPTPFFKVNLMMPNPRVSLLVYETPSRQHWAYVGGGIGGGTWAYRRNDGSNDRISYGEYRLVIGWESKLPQPPGTFRPMGTTFNVELGYLFGREFEFESASPAITIGSGLMLRSAISF